jgi:hypothetical protein
VSRRDKQALRLAGLEAELLELLRPALAKAAHGRDNSMFLCERVRPADWPPGLRSEWADETARLCDDVIELRGQLGIDVGDCAAARYLDACREAHDTGDAHRGGTSRIATRLLKEIFAA